MRSLKSKYNNRTKYVNHSDAYRNTRKWKRTRHYVLHRDGGVCAQCGDEPYEQKDLHVDHITPSHLYDGSAYDSDNLQVLCRKCHASKTMREVM